MSEARIRAIQAELEKAATHLDEVAEDIDEYGVIAVSAPVITKVGQFSFGLTRTAKDYYDEKFVEGAARTAVVKQTTIQVQAQGTIPTPTAPAASPPASGTGVPAAIPDARTMAAGEAVEPAGASTTTTTTTETSTSGDATFSAGSKLGAMTPLLGNYTGDLDLNPSTRISLAHESRTKQELLNFMMAPKDLGDNKVAYMCLLEISCQPGNRTHRGYAAEVIVHVDYARYRQNPAPCTPDEGLMNAVRTVHAQLKDFKPIDTTKLDDQELATKCAALEAKFAKIQTAARTSFEKVCNRWRTLPTNSAEAETARLELEQIKLLSLSAQADFNLSCILDSGETVSERAINKPEFVQLRPVGLTPKIDAAITALEKHDPKDLTCWAARLKVIQKHYADRILDAKFGDNGLVAFKAADIYPHYTAIQGMAKGVSAPDSAPVPEDGKAKELLKGLKDEQKKEIVDALNAAGSMIENAHLTARINWRQEGVNQLKGQLPRWEGFNNDEACQVEVPEVVYGSDEWRTQPLVVAAYPMLSAQVLDLRHSYRQQQEIGALLSAAGQNLSGKAFLDFAKRLEQDVQTRSVITTLTATSHGGASFGFRVEPHLVGLDNPGSRSAKPDMVMESTTFPALIMIVCDRQNLAPSVTTKSGVGPFDTGKGRYDYLVFHVETIWQRVGDRAKQRQFLGRYRDLMGKPRVNEEKVFDRAKHLDQATTYLLRAEEAARQCGLGFSGTVDSQGRIRPAIGSAPPAPSGASASAQRGLLSDSSRVKGIAGLRIHETIRRRLSAMTAIGMGNSVLQELPKFDPPTAPPGVKVVSIQPTTGWLNAENLFIIDGENFDGKESVSIGGVPGKITAYSDSHLAVSIPAFYSPESNKVLETREATVVVGTRSGAVTLKPAIKFSQKITMRQPPAFTVARDPLTGKVSRLTIEGNLEDPETVNLLKQLLPLLPGEGAGVKINFTEGKIHFDVPNGPKN